MVEPIYLIGLLLGIAFLLPVLYKWNKTIAITLFFGTLSFVFAAAGQWVWELFINSNTTIHVFTAGFKPPISINLQVGKEEAFFLFSINLMAIINAIYMFKWFNEKLGVKAFVLYLMLTLGMNGLVMTRDIFNLFVFLEITSIATYSLIGMDRQLKSLISGFKYMIAGNIAGIFLLLGIMFFYIQSGSLNIDGIHRHLTTVTTTTILALAMFSLFFTFVIEMKLFPANGWALDVYEGAHPGIAAFISTGNAAAVLFAFYKVMPLMSDMFIQMAIYFGMITFMVSNWMGIKQQITKRMLGYSSIGQMGLVLAALAFGLRYDSSHLVFPFIIAALFLNHFLAKAGLFWLAGIINEEKNEQWSFLRNKVVYSTLLGVFTLGLIGFPPFPGFWGKWNFVMELAKHNQFHWIWILFAGSLLEAAYMLRWFIQAVSGSNNTKEISLSRTITYSVSPIIFAVVYMAVGFYFAGFSLGGKTLSFIPLFAAIILFALDWLPAKIKAGLSILSIGGYAYTLLPGLNGLQLFFNVLFMLGMMVVLLSSINRNDRSVGYYPLILILTGSLVGMVNSTNMLQFFFSWEMMTVSSFLILLRGRKAAKPSLIYILFSLGGAFLIFAGMAYSVSLHPGSILLVQLFQMGRYTHLIYILLGIGFLVKTGALGLHIWIAGAYSDSEDDFTPVFSGLLSKAGVLGLVILLLAVQVKNIHLPYLNYLLGWIGTLTALFGTLIAVFQEDAKKLLAYSSMGQVGYIVMGLAAMSHLGWAAALWHTVNHFLFKGLLFLAVAGVIYRTGTRYMYQMGGLIKRMPLSFIGVLIGIIALAGMPPLSGFGGKWLLYSALIEKGWYLQTGVAFFASTIAFLYCFRLIHTIFLGIPKPHYLKIKEAPVWFIIPQFILIALIMVISIRPAVLLKPISEMIQGYFPATLTWSQNTVYSSLGYWNATMIMIIVAAIFVFLLITLLLKGPKPQKVKPFNIVYAAERPESPELTHYAYNFFAPYRRALGFLIKPKIKAFWGAVAEWTDTTAHVLRQIYTGNGQTYVMFIFLTGILIYFIAMGGM